MSVDKSLDKPDPTANCDGGRDRLPRNGRFVDETGTMLRVRPYDNADFESLVAFYEEYPQRHRSMSLPPLARSQIESWLEKLIDRGRNLLVIDGDRLVGHVAYAPRSGSEPELVIFIDEAYHGRGIGTELCKHAIACAAMDGHDTMKLTVDSNNEGAVHVYESLGFQTVHENNRSLKMRLEIDEDVKENLTEP